MRKKLLLSLFISGVLVSATGAWAGTCTVDATQTNQFIHCIGASSAWSGIGSLGQALFAEDNVNGHLGLSSLRARIDPNNNFGPEVSTLATAHSVNPNVLLWATEWSPPAQYKANNNVNGGASNDTFLGASSGSPNSADTGLASYQVSFIQYAQSHGAPLYALSIQNEPNFNPTYEACLWTAGQFDVYVQAFHSAIQNAGLSTKIMLPEPDNTFGMNLASTTMDDPTAAPMVGIIGTHLYGSPDPAPLPSYGFTHVTNQEWWETEMSGNTTDIPGALQEAGWIQNSLVNSNMNAFHYWWLTDLISNGNLTIKAYVLGNYSKFIRPGYYRMGATAVPSAGVSVSAFKNTNNSSPQTIVFVAINGNSSSTNQTFAINGVNVTSVTPWVTDSGNNLVAKSPVAVSGGSFTYSLTASSITSFVGVVSGGTPVPTNTPTKTNTPVPPTATFTPVVKSTWRVNAGGPSYTDTLGNVWSADTNFNGGSTIASGGTVTGTSDSTLYDTQRYGTFSYSFNVPAGTYQVTLKLAETYSGDFAAGDRVFNISINGAVVASNLDIFAQVGSNAADDKVFNNVSPSGGVITIQFTGGSSTDTNAMVEALQVIPQPATPTMTRTNTPVPPTATPTATRTSTFTSTPTATATKTNTPVPPTATATLTPANTATSTFTSVPPTVTNTPAPPTATSTAAPPTNTPTAAPPTTTPTFTLTPLPPTATDSMTPTASLTATPSATPTHTQVPPTSTFTAAPPTATNTPAPPTRTMTPTNTAIATATRTNTPVPPTATNTPVPPTATFTPTVMVSNGSFKVQLLSGVTSDTTNSPHPQIQIVNTGTGPLNLNNVTVRYWFNCDCTNQTLQAWVDWAGLMPNGTSVTGNVAVSVHPTSLGGQTDYVLYSFTGNMVLQPGQSINVQSRFNKSDWSNMTQSNDWSFAPTTSYTDWTQVTGYMSGSLVWGKEPVGGSSALTVSSAMAIPNPSTGSGTTLSFTVNGSSTGTSASVLDANHSLSTDPKAKIVLGIYTLSGRLIWSQTLTGGAYGTTGQHEIYWNEKDLRGTGLANGVYLLKVTVESNGQTSSTIGKILILG
ncbi:MAG TPA: malectin domain-containing carbohydrate-binding protein [bacterium]|nr:malectin domain-containing carbohydrate-binding protein [bacterium]